MKLPFEGSVREVFTSPAASGAYVLAAGATTSPREVFIGDRGEARDTGIISPAPLDYSGVTTLSTRARSKDGTMVPIDVVYPKNLKRDGTNPTSLTGYGAYGLSRSNGFHPEDLAWYERGGVRAICRVRGGGELGESWHKGGQFVNKQNAFDDFVACANELFALGFTRPDRLSAEGSSAGGVLIGGVLTQHPELFGAAVVDVGMMNVLRFETTPGGPANALEFGSVQTEAGFNALMVQDGYSHVTHDTNYPAVLLLTGANDPRVPSWQSAKMAARLQAATGSHRPVMLRVEFDAGHGHGSTRSQLEAETADRFAFLLSELLGN